eukprot:322523-Pleurochrysis_carterae.AAC.2
MQQLACSLPHSVRIVARFARGHFAASVSRLFTLTRRPHEPLHLSSCVENSALSVPGPRCSSGSLDSIARPYSCTKLPHAQLKSVPTPLALLLLLLHPRTNHDEPRDRHVPTARRVLPRCALAKDGKRGRQRGRNSQDRELEREER